MKPMQVDFTEHEKMVELFDEAFLHPRRKYVLMPVDAEVARKWLWGNAYMLSFGWPTGSNWETRLKELGPMRQGDLMDLEELSNMRNRCGWFVSERVDPVAAVRYGQTPYVDWGYFCEHPANMDGCRPGECHAYECPIAAEVDREEIRRRDPKRFREEFKGNDDQPYDEMVLYARPRYAYVPNVVVLGCEGWER